MLQKRFYLCCTFVIILFFVICSHAQNLSFVVGADNRNYINNYRIVLQELNDMTVNPEPSLPYPQFFISCGDIDPVASNMAIYHDTLTYPNLPPFYPVVGNHEFETPSDMSAILNVLLPNLINVVNTGKQATYSFDYENIHCVVLDLYSSNDDGEVDVDLQAWLQRDLNITNQDHIFIFGHEPAFPRHRHVGDALDMFPDSRNAFWKMLVNDPRVRAYFCGHTHYFSRMRVVDPTSVERNDFPDQEGGVYQIDVGAIGNGDGTDSDGNLTLVYAHIQEDSIRFRTITSPRYSSNWSVADEWSIKGTKRFWMQLTYPKAGNEISDVVNVTWSDMAGWDTSWTTTLYVSNDAAAHWDTLWSQKTEANTYVWDTANHPDGTRYMLRIVSKGDSGFGMTQSEGTFTINNPGNAIPEIELLAPTEGMTLTGSFDIEWTASDADGDRLKMSLEASTDKGCMWQTLAVNEPNNGIFVLDTWSMANSNSYILKLKCTDGNVWVEDVSETFAIRNVRDTISDINLQHISGTGNGTIIANVITPTDLTDHTYQIVFDDTSTEVKTYDVIDLNTTMHVVKYASQLDGHTEGPQFDGLRLLIHDYKTTILDQQNTGWTTGMSDLSYQISLPEINMGTEILYGFAYPADYQITVHDHVVDTSSSFLDAPQIPINFTVWNTTEDHQVDVIFIELDNDHLISSLDEIYILENDESGEPMLTWRIFYTGDANTIMPAFGDVFTLKTFKPFTHKDVFQFNTQYTDIANDKLNPIPQRFILYQNYPNPFFAGSAFGGNPTTTISYQIPKRTIVKLSIYNIPGQLVETLINEPKEAGFYSVSWNASFFSSGIYFYKITAGNYTAFKKCLILK